MYMRAKINLSMSTFKSWSITDRQTHRQTQMRSDILPRRICMR